ncbi:hypothetical protein FHT76_006788 [Rhizobium sp. BK176]|nr:hypothetical protein [Rhizobium sp. BK399]MCS3742909.1 hypothetical protein [Rhizobium sp. BK661]MCS4095078.1 hypothetical protein [Rhizobium sp. BK176]
MLVRGVIDDKIDQDAYAALFCAMGEFDEIAKRAVSTIDVVVVGNVVTVVASGGRLEGLSHMAVTPSPAR